MEHDVLDALALGLGQVDLIVHAGKHIVEVVGVLGVEGDIDIPLLPLVVALGGPLHVSLELRAGDAHPVKGVVKLVDVEDVAVVDVALGQIAGALEEGGGGDVGAGVLQLDGVDQIHDGGIHHPAGGDAADLVLRLEAGGSASQGRAALALVAGAAAVDVVDGLLMGLGHQGDLPELLAGGHAGHIHNLHRAVNDLIVGVQGQIKAGDVPAAVAHAADDGGALLLVDHHVVVGHLEHVDLRVVVQNLLGGVGAALLVKFGVHAHVGGHHDYVGLVADLVDGLADGHVGGLIDGVVNAVLAAVPDGDIRGDHADDGQLHAAPLHNRPARAGDRLALGAGDVGGQNREAGLSQNGLHGGDAPVELVVAQGHGVIAHVVHGGDDRMGLLRGLVIQIVGHDGALDVVAGVDEEGVGVLGPHLLDVGVEPGHAVVVGLRVVFVGIAPDISVHV